MKRGWVLAVILGVLIAQSIFGSSSVMTDQCVNGACVILARTSPVGLLASGVLLLLVFLHRPRPSTPVLGETVKVRRRLAAFLIDVFTAMAIVGPLAALPMLIYAALLSGTFEWGVQSTAPAWWDHVFAVVLVIAGLAGLVAYFCLPIPRGRQTLGQYVLGYRVEPREERSPNYLALGLLGFVGICMWPVSLAMAASRPDKEFWWSRVGRVHAVSLVDAVPA